MAAGKEIKRLRADKMSATKAAERIGIGVDKLRKWEERDSDPVDTLDVRRVEYYFGCKLEELVDLKEFNWTAKPILLNAEENFKQSVLEEPQIQYNKGQKNSSQELSPDIIGKLTQSNLNLSEANRSQSEANKQQAVNEARLISLLEKSEGAQKEIPSALLTMIPGLLEAMAEIASGTRYHSVEEARAILGNKLGLTKPLKQN